MYCVDLLIPVMLDHFSIDKNDTAPPHVACYITTTNNSAVAAAHLPEIFSGGTLGSGAGVVSSWYT